MDKRFTLLPELFCVIPKDNDVIKVLVDIYIYIHISLIIGPSILIVRRKMVSINPNWSWCSNCA